MENPVAKEFRGVAASKDNDIFSLDFFSPAILDSLERYIVFQTPTKFRWHEFGNVPLRKLDVRK